jgi:hypothetical protein
MGFVFGVSQGTVVTDWDSTQRSGRRGLVLTGYNEASFGRVAKSAVAIEGKKQAPILFVKSWNEWADGNTVEPLFHGHWSVGSILKGMLRHE